MFHNNLRWEKYYKNITPLMEQIVKESLIETGFEIVDLKQTFKSKSMDPLDMKASAIIAAAQDECDAVLLFHYTELGDYHLDISAKVVDKTHYTWANGRGLQQVKYSFALFDVRKKQRVLSVWHRGISIPDMLAHDPEIRNNPQWAQKVVVDEKGNGSSETVFIQSSFTEEEILTFTARALNKGYRYKKKGKIYEEEVIMGIEQYWQH
jgi:hypothetical protein